MKTIERTILFRGQRVDNGEWVYGYFVKDPDEKFRIYLQPFDEATSNTYYVVKPETIGQYSGINDRNNKEIFEGDKFRLGVDEDLYEVRFEYGCFMAFFNGLQYGLVGELDPSFIEVVGNINDKK
jgi:hypothetical protein